MPQLTRPKALLGILALTLTPIAVSQQRPAIDLNTYSQIEIDRPVEVVWPFILAPNSWKTERRIVHHAGSEGKLGEVFAVVTPAQPDKIWFLAENVELVPNERRTLKMYDEAGTLLGYTVWQLEKLEGNRTLLRNEVHGESVLKAEVAKKTSAADLAAQRREGYDVNKKRIDAELLVLKRLVESK